MLIAAALVFDILNGLHDAANSIAFLFFGLHVAETVGRFIVAADIVTAGVIYSALCAAGVRRALERRAGASSPPGR